MTDKATQKSDLCPQNSAHMFCIVEVFVISLQFARITSVIVMKISSKSCTTIDVTIPPALSNACGKFKRPAPKVALTIKKIVLSIPVPANIIISQEYISRTVSLNLRNSHQSVQDYLGNYISFIFL